MRLGLTMVTCTLALAVAGCGGSDGGGGSDKGGGGAAAQQGSGGGDREAKVRQAAQAVDKALVASDGEGFCRSLTQEAANAFGRYVEGTGPKGGRRTCAQFVERFASTDPLLLDAKPGTEVQLSETGATVGAKAGPPLAFEEQDGEFKLALEQREGFQAVTTSSEACIARQDQRLNNRLPSANRNLISAYYLREADRTARLREVVAEGEVRSEQQGTKQQLLRFLDSEEKVARNVARDLKGKRNLASGGARGQGNRLIRFQRRSLRFLARLGVVCQRYGDAADQAAQTKYQLKTGKVCERAIKGYNKLPSYGDSVASLRARTTAEAALYRKTNKALSKFKAPKGYAAAVRRTLGASKGLGKAAEAQRAAVDNLNQKAFDKATEDLELANIRSQVAWVQVGVPVCGGF